MWSKLVELNKIVLKKFVLLSVNGRRWKVKNNPKKTQDIEEEKEKDRRRDNLILYNIPESASQNIAERIRNDWESIKQIFERKGLQLDQKKVYRLGKEQPLGKTRPLLIRFISQEAKKEILKFCNDLKK